MKKIASGVHELSSTVQSHTLQLFLNLHSCEVLQFYSHKRGFPTDSSADGPDSKQTVLSDSKVEIHLI